MYTTLLVAIGLFGSQAFAQEAGVNFLDGHGEDGDVNPADTCLHCTYNNSRCQFSDQIEIDPIYDFWTVVINKDNFGLNNPGAAQPAPAISRAILQSPILTGVKCLYFSAFTSRHEINWVLSIRNAHRETIVGLQGNRKLAKKITVGLDTKEYIIAFYLYGSENHGTPTYGTGFIGKVLVTAGPCSEDKVNLNCTFDDGFCSWAIHNGKYDWYQVPFGLHHTLPHTIEWGALAAFAGKGGIWSPVVRPFNVRCFSFIYARGEGKSSFLRVWLLYRIPGFKDIKVMLFEDTSDSKILKKEVQVSIFVPYNFQIAFEGRSRTVLHGVIILNTALSPHFCEGTGSYYDLKAPVPGFTTLSEGNVTATSKPTTPTTPFSPI